MAIKFSSVSEDVALFGRLNRDTVEYVRERTREGMRKWTSSARERYERIRDDVLQTVSLDNLSRKLEAAGRITRSKFRDDSIRRLSDIVDFQNPPDKMLNYLAANPTVRRAMRANRCDGWSDRYQDHYPDTIGEDHYHYRRATNGLFMEDEEGKLTATTYFERLEEGDAELDLDRQEDIKFAWEALDELFQLGQDDPTSKWNSQLT